MNVGNTLVSEISQAQMKTNDSFYMKCPEKASPQIQKAD
jgi:hypothetical protein